MYHTQMRLLMSLEIHTFAIVVVATKTTFCALYLKLKQKYYPLRDSRSPFSTFQFSVPTVVKLRVYQGELLIHKLGDNVGLRMVPRALSFLCQRNYPNLFIFLKLCATHYELPVQEDICTRIHTRTKKRTDTIRRQSLI